MKTETMQAATYVLKTWGIESTLEYPGHIQIYRERSGGSGRNVKQSFAWGDANELFGCTLIENEGTEQHFEDYIETDLSSDCEESGRVARAIYEAIFGPMDIDTLKEFAQKATPLNDDDWGSDRQVTAENGFGYLLKELLGKEQFDKWQHWALKATSEEFLAYGIKLCEEKEQGQ